MPRGKIVAVDHVGGEQVVVREQVLSETHTIRVVFHGFANLPHARGDQTASSALLCHGSQWKLRLYPGGQNVSNEDEVYLSVFLYCVSMESDNCKVKAKCTFRVPLADGIYSRDMGVGAFCRKSTGMGFNDFILRSDVLDPSKGFLVDGNLTIEVDIQVYKDASPFWEPKSELNLDMLGLLELANHTGDVKFEVGGETFSAHLNILQVRAPQLAETALAEEGARDTDTPIHIQGIKPSAFRSLLRFVYANDVENLSSEARELLDVANRFGCKGLKLAAEAELAASGISVDTAADLILLGDSQNCALLKEAAIEFFAANLESLMSSSGWANITESAPIMKEIMEVLASKKKQSAPAASDEERDYKLMCVSTLRRKLDEKGLDVDGSREMLISRLGEG
jgi:speckle-type POZ protein